MSIKWQDSLVASQEVKTEIEKVMKASTLPYDAYAKTECGRVAMNLASYARMYPEAVKFAASKIDTDTEA